MRVLITGFGPFPGAPFNPSAALAKALAGRRRPAFAALDRTVHIFETTYGSVDRELPKLLAQKPDIVLMFGVAGRRRQLCLRQLGVRNRQRNRPYRPHISCHILADRAVAARHSAN